MAFQINTASRKKAKLKLGLSGVSGAGKTYSALLLARGIAGSWEKVTLIDTENGSGELYSHLGPYKVIPFGAPFDPRRYVEAIVFAVKSGAQVIVIDSITHEWDGIGGCLELQANLGGRYQDWSKVTPLHKAFVDAILQSPVHVITCTRKKQDYEMTNDGGKAKVQKMGLKEIQRDGYEYELTINFAVEISHYATASKDRTGLFMPRGPFQITQQTGEELIAWANSGAEVAAPEAPKALPLPTSTHSPSTEKQSPSVTPQKLPSPLATAAPVPSATVPTTGSSVSTIPAQTPGGQNQKPTSTGIDSTPTSSTQTETPAKSPQPNGQNTSSSPNGGYISEPQRKRLWGICGESGWQADDLKAFLSMEHDVTSSKEIPKTIYENICGYVKANPIKEAR